MSQRTRTRDLLYDHLPPNPIPGTGNIMGTLGKLIFNNMKDFPEIGRYDILYFNRDNNTLYCWDGDNGYVPVRASQMEAVSIDGGGAADA